MTNRWSCSVQAASKILGITTDELIKKIGHDGSQIVFPKLPEPMCRAGFHIQEIQDVAAKLGYMVMTIEARPVATPDGIHTREIYTDEYKLSERMHWYFDNFNGIAVGQKYTGITWHYNVWKGQHWFDAGGRELQSPNIQIAYFYAFILS